MEVSENMEDSLEIKRRSWEARMTQNGKKETQAGPEYVNATIRNTNTCISSA